MRRDSTTRIPAPGSSNEQAASRSERKAAGARTAAPREGRGAPRWARNLIAIAFWVAVWQVAAMSVGHEILLASPAAVVARLAELAPTPEFWTSIGVSLSRIFIGFALSVALGAAAAAAAFRFAVARTLAAPLVAAMKSVPVVAFIIVVLIWVPSRDLSVVISFLMGFPIVYTNILEGLDSTDRDLLDAAAVLGIDGARLVRCVYAPHLVPYAQAACSLALGMCWKAGVAAEVIGLPASTIGEHLYDAKVYLQTPDLFAWTIVIILVSLVFEFAFKRLLKAATRHWFPE